MSDVVLEAQHIAINFGGLKAVNDFNLTLRQGELVGLIGPNGAGKTTVFNILTGVYKATEGDYFVNGEKISDPTTFKLVRKGLVRTFQNIRLFNKMSVLENILCAENFNMSYSKLEGIFRLPKYWSEEKAARERAMELLSIFKLDQYANLDAESLPYGKQRQLEIVRALASSPNILLLDEPAAGMNERETKELMESIAFIREKFNLAIFLIEHDMDLVLGICEKLIVLNHGEILAQGDPKDVIQNPAVIEAYLGG
ncbi:ABC transporter ATP-binding protein [Peptoniphilus equinus]|uniref:ABC transporter ATP-binding protein n=1 Tax=Peptoniphilus equinus TaxID=3016343 RepID=A0ABY7QUQ4_9FIRM|nr:ABC transporter ATP-binding protein [Peptoniphilus equinus]WBW50511.1 ABC transporter ATP-binding protein [Peptoniphilus equinus]